MYQHQIQDWKLENGPQLCNIIVDDKDIYIREKRQHLGFELTTGTQLIYRVCKAASKKEFNYNGIDNGKSYSIGFPFIVSKPIYWQFYSKSIGEFLSIAESFVWMRFCVEIRKLMEASALGLLFDEQLNKAIYILWPKVIDFGVWKRNRILKLSFLSCSCLDDLYELSFLAISSETIVFTFQLTFVKYRPSMELVNLSPNASEMNNSFTFFGQNIPRIYVILCHRNQNYVLYFN